PHANRRLETPSVPRIDAGHPEAPVGDSQNVLLISSYKEDTQTLLRIVERLRCVRDVRPISLLPVFGTHRDAALQAVRGAGVDLFEGPGEQDMQVQGHGYNPFYRAHVIRRAY